METNASPPAAKTSQALSIWGVVIGGILMGIPSIGYIILTDKFQDALMGKQDEFITLVKSYAGLIIGGVVMGLIGIGLCLTSLIIFLRNRSPARPSGPPPPPLPPRIPPQGA